MFCIGHHRGVSYSDILYVFVQRIYADSFDVGVFVTATTATATTASPVPSWCYHFDVYEYFWNKKPKGMSGVVVVCVPPAQSEHRVL